MMCAYGKYRQSRDASWQCLIDCGVRRLPVPVGAIAAQMNIGLCEYSSNLSLLCRSGMAHLLEAEGFAYADPRGRLLIFYNEHRPTADVRITIAHELGHIFLSHMGAELPRGLCLEPRGPAPDHLELAADRFAARLLAPACILHALNLRTAGEIAAVCNIPHSIAAARARRMATLYRREEALLAKGKPSCFLRSALEQTLYENFSDFLSEYRS